MRKRVRALLNKDMRIGSAILIVVLMATIMVSVSLLFINISNVSNKNTVRVTQDSDGAEVAALSGLNDLKRRYAANPSFMSLEQGKFRLVEIGTNTQSGPFDKATQYTSKIAVLVRNKKYYSIERLVGATPSYVVIGYYAGVKHAYSYNNANCPVP